MLEEVDDLSKISASADGLLSVNLLESSSANFQLSREMVVRSHTTDT
jgi:hypothetical protein